MFTVNQKDFAEALRIATKLSARSTFTPVFHSSRIEATSDGLVITTTDLEMGATVCVPLVTGQAGKGTFLVDTAQLAAVVHSMKGNDQVPISVEEGILVVGKTRLRTNQDVTDFPDIPAPPKTTQAVYTPAPGFDQVVRFCAPAVSKDAGRYTLTGLYLDFPRGRLVATDGKRLHAAPMGKKQKVSPIILPTRIFSILTPECLIIPHTPKKAETPGYVFLAFQKGMAFVRLLEGAYPNYSRVLPKKYPARFEAGRTALLEGLKCVLPLVPKRDPSCTMTANGCLDILASDPATGAESAVQVEGKLKGPAVTIRINPHYLWDGLTALPGKNVRIHFHGDKVPVRVEDADAGWSAWVMPLKTTGGETNNAESVPPGTRSEVRPQDKEVPADQPGADEP